MSHSEILILGASGFVGKELIKRFSSQNINVKALVRNPSSLQDAPQTVEVLKGDLSDKASLKKAFKGIKTVYYLVHSMNQKESFKDLEKTHAENVSENLTQDMRLIYLSGLGEGEGLSEHLESRHQVGEILRASSASVIEFRASIIIGEGSLSFELMRGIVERFPIIMNTNWSKALCQPLSKDDLLKYLQEAKELNLIQGNEIIEIAGPDKITYEALLSHYARLKGLKRPTLQVETLPKSFAQKAVDLFLPEYSIVGKHLLDSIEIPTTANLTKAKNYFDFEPMDLDEAIMIGIKNSEKNFETLDYKDILKVGFNTKDLGATVLKDEINLTLPLKEESIIKILTKAKSLSQGMSFIPIKLPKLSKENESWRLELPSLESSENYLSFEVHGSTLKGIHIFKPKRFFEAETFIIYQRSRDKILDFFQTIITKFSKE